MKHFAMASLAAVLALATSCRLGSGGFALVSPAIRDDAILPAEFTGDGAGISPPLAWRGAPAGTKAYALIMHHVDPQGMVKWYWVLYNIPLEAAALPKGATGIGLQGTNSVNHRQEYAPPHSKGPGLKTYTCTLYALSEPVVPEVGPEQVTRELLLKAMAGKILGQAELTLSYTRPASAFARDPTQAAPAPSSRP